MSNRDYKNFEKGGIYHIYNRGDNKEIIFRDEQDYRALLFRLGSALGFEKKELDGCDITKSPKSRTRIGKLQQDTFKLHAFCLMPNHFHFLIEQYGDISVSKLFSKVFTSFSKYINLKHKRVGHVFQDKFKSVKIETNSQLMLISTYIHMNPVKDGLVISPEKYVWSSYYDFVGNRKNPIVQTKLLLEVFGSIENFKNQSTKLYKRVVSKTVFDMF